MIGNWRRKSPNRHAGRGDDQLPSKISLKSLGVFLVGLGLAIGGLVGTGVVINPALAGSGGDTKSISAKALSDHECDNTEWHFVATQVDSEADAPASIHVTWANGDSQNVDLSKFTGGVAHYSTTANLDSTVTSATADIYIGWSGQFNLSHGPCGENPPPDKTKVYGNVIFNEGSVACVDYQVVYTNPTYVVAGNEHVVYDTSRGEHTANFGDSVTVNATGVDDSSKYELAGQTTWSHTFGVKPSPPEDCGSTPPVIAPTGGLRANCEAVMGTLDNSDSTGSVTFEADFVLKSGENGSKQWTLAPGDTDHFTLTGLLPGSTVLLWAPADVLLDSVTVPEGCTTPPPIHQGKHLTVTKSCGQFTLHNRNGFRVEVVLSGGDKVFVPAHGQRTVKTSRHHVHFVATGHSKDGRVVLSQTGDVTVTQKCGHHHKPPRHHQPPVCNGVVKNGVCLPSTTSKTGLGQIGSGSASASTAGSFGDQLYLYGLVGLTIAAGGTMLLKLRRKPAPARHKSNR